MPLIVLVVGGLGVDICVEEVPCQLGPLVFIWAPIQLALSLLHQQQLGWPPLAVD